MIRQIQLITLVFSMCFNLLHSQWKHEVSPNATEKIFVKDDKNSSVFLIEKTPQGDVNFIMENLTLDGCPIKSVHFGFDNYNKNLKFNVKKINKNSLEILFDEIEGLAGLKDFSTLVKAKNILYAKLIDECNLNPLEITDVSWKNSGQDKYTIKIRLKIRNKGFRELYGDFRLFKPTKTIKFRY